MRVTKKMIQAEADYKREMFRFNTLLSYLSRLAAQAGNDRYIQAEVDVVFGFPV